MGTQPEDPRELGYYLALAQVGLEMVGAILLGVFVDWLIGWGPWGIIGGTILGFFGAMFHLVSMVQQHDRMEKKPPKEPPK